MKKGKRQIVWAAVVLSIAAGAAAQQMSIKLPPDNPVAQLKAGPGQETASRNCGICHSTDYIVRQPPMDASRWEAEVKKMINVFGARISDSDVKEIADYLAKNYGSDANKKTAKDKH